MRPRAWIEPCGGGRFRIFMESFSIPGTAHYTPHSYASPENAARAAVRDRYDVQDGKCPLPGATQEQVKDSYRAQWARAAADDVLRRMPVMGNA